MYYRKTKNLCWIMARAALLLVIAAMISFISSDGVKAAEGKGRQEVQRPGEYIFPDSSREYLSESDLEGKDHIELLIGRNEIFARHGYIFEMELLKKHFENTSWYKGTVAGSSFNSDKIFNDQEKKNIDLISGAEKEKGSPLVPGYDGSSKKQQSGEYIFPDSDEEYLSKSDLEDKPDISLLISRNEIFARHGYIFEMKLLKEYFESTSWYKGTVAGSKFNGDKIFNNIEKKNVNLILELENERNSPFAPGHSSQSPSKSGKGVSSSSDKNTVKAEIDGREVTFYVVNTELNSNKAEGEYYNIIACSLSGSGKIERYISFHLDPGAKTGTTLNLEKLYYYPNYTGNGDLQYVTSSASGRGSGSYTLTAKEGSGPYMEGAFDAVATASYQKGSRSVSIAGNFCVCYGERDASAGELYDALENGRSSSGSSFYQYDSSGGTDSSDFSSGRTSVDHSCSSCKGTGLCYMCGGDGLNRRGHEGNVHECNTCRGSGKCQVCYGTGKIY